MPESQSIVVIGASTGGISALKTLLQALPDGFPLPIFITLHTGGESVLPEILSASSAFTVRHAVDGEKIVPGLVRVAPPGAHLLLSDGHTRLGRGAKENYCRPAIDPMFRSAAYSYRERAVAVVLTGELDDGCVGLQAIKACGGTAIVQSPDEAEAPSMPSSALDYVQVDYCLPLKEIARQLVTTAFSKTVRPPPAISEHTSQALAFECAMDFDPASATSEVMDRLAPRSALVCPECQGVLWEMQQSPLRFRCHTGHSYTARSLAQSQNIAVEEALWAAIRAVRDKEVFFNRQQALALDKGRALEAAEYALAAEQARGNAQVLVRLTTGAA